MISNPLAGDSNYARLHLVCGERGSGKTQVCAGLAQLLSLYGEDLAGLISPGVFVEGRKTAIEAYDLRSQQRRRLATLRAAQDAAEITTKEWAFDSAALAWGDGVLRSATPCGVPSWNTGIGQFSPAPTAGRAPGASIMPRAS